MTEAKKLTERQRKRRRYRENLKKRKKAEKESRKQRNRERRAKRNPHFKSACFDKQPHESVTKAFFAISALFHKKADAQRMSVYHCRFCKKYHLTSAKYRPGKQYYVFTIDREEWEELQRGRQ